jgi:neutral ceramidase
MRAGFAATDITPPVGTVLNGFIARTSPGTGVDVPLSARGLVLETEGTRWLLISLDLLGLSPVTADSIAADLARRLDLPADHIVLACTHTHSGPMTVRLRGLGPADEDYVAFLQERIGHTASLAASRRERVRLSWSSVPVSVGINRRQVVPGDGSVVLGRNPDGPKDDVVRVLRLQGERTSTILFHHACHPYCLGGDSTLISADFWGHAATVLKEKGHDSIYMNGCAGDITPDLAFGGPEAALATGRKLAEAVLEACDRAQPDEDATMKVGSARFAIPHDEAPSMTQIERDLELTDRTVREDERQNPVVVERL